MIKKKLLFIYR